MIKKSTKNIKLPKRVKLALDFHEKEYYGDKNHTEVLGSKGGKYVRRFLELNIKQKIRYKFGDVEVTLAFLKVEDKVYVYVTNTNYSPVKLCILYAMRWQIETNFREQNKFSFKTKSINFGIRYFAFAVAGILFNAWQLTRRKLVHIKESYLYKQILIEELLRVWQTITSRRVVKKVDYFLLA